MRKVITMTVLCLMVFLMVVFMVSCSKNTTSDLSVTSATTGTISGKVVTSDTEVGVGQAVITIGGTTVATTASDGTFIIAGAKPGNEMILATRGQDTGSTTVAITAGEVTEATITIVTQVTNSISAGNVRVVGRIIDAVSGEGIDGVAVQMTDVGKSTMTTLWNSAVTEFATYYPQNVPESPSGPNGPEHHGYFYLENVTPGVHTFAFSKTGYFDKQISMDISTSQLVVNETLVYDPKATGIIAGYVSFDSDGLMAGDTSNNNGSFDGTASNEWKATLSLDTGQTTTTVDIDGKVGYFKFENIPPRHLIYQSGVLIDPGYTLSAVTTRVVNNVPITFQGQVIHIEVDEAKTTIANVILGGSSLNTDVNPSILLPAANEIITAATPTIRWEALSVATDYVVKVLHIENADPVTGLGGVTNEVMMEKSLTGAYSTTYDGTDLVNNEWYALKVYSLINGVLSSGSGIRFKKVPYLTPTRIAPLDGDRTDPNETILAWNATDSGGSYVIHLYTTDETTPANGCDFTRVIYQYETGSATANTLTITNTVLLPDKQYWWAVAQKNPTDNSPVVFATITDTGDVDKDGNTTEQVIDSGYFRTAPQPGVVTISAVPTSYFGNGVAHIVWTDPAAYAADGTHASHWHHVYVDDSATPKVIYANSADVAVSNGSSHTISVTTVNQYGVESRLAQISGTPGTDPAITLGSWTVAPSTATAAAGSTTETVNTSVSFTVSNTGGQSVTGLSISATAVGPGSGTATYTGTVNLAGNSSVVVTLPMTINVNKGTAGQTAVFSFVGSVTGGTSQTGVTGIAGGGSSGSTGLTVTYQ